MKKGAAGTTPKGSLGEPLERFEDLPLLAGRGRYADDLPVSRRTLHAAVLRSPHAHAEILSLDATAALALPGVACVVTGENARAWTHPFTAVLPTPAEHWCLALDRVRHVGEPVALVAAADRYLAEDAAAAIAVEYRPLPPIVKPRQGIVVSDRSFRYGDPESAFAEARHRISVEVNYPRNAGCPIECCVVIAEYDPGEGAYEVTANFQGPMSLHPVMALALGVPANKLRLKTPPNSGGSFGAKHALFSAVPLAAIAAKKAGAPVKWVEDRLEHLSAATAAPGRVSRLEAAVGEDGEVLALAWDQIEDCGAYLRAPAPATLYRMHGNMSGAYRVENLAIRNRVVLTNKTPSGLVRGFGGPQVYFALERLMQRIAVELHLDPLAVIKKNLVPSGVFPYRCPAGALLDSGDYPAAVERAAAAGGLAELLARRDEARCERRLYGVGFAAIVEPSISNMGYVTTASSPDERRRGGPKSGALAAATVFFDPLGGVNVAIDSLPQGQGHRTAVAQIVGDVFGLAPGAIAVAAELDTAKDAWSIAAGNYSSRFAGAAAGAAYLAAMRLRDKLARIAAAALNLPPGELAFAGGRIFAAGNPDNGVSFARMAGASHWSPETLPNPAAAALRETVFWSPPTLAAPNEADEVNAAAAYGFVFDFCGVEIDRGTGHVRIDKYVTMHDAGRILNRALFEGQVQGGFAQGLGAALYESLDYDEGGAFLSGSFADYALPTAYDVPEPVMLHMESPSAVTPLGAKGVAEGNAMSTPVCIANAVADALGVADLELPLTPAKLAALIGRDV
ncbi:MAG TPA: xanthine dehydrogenase family protein molybdopterin-binding subunit [Stellaceae bacterium]|nr:xanthine dehydrogenase family protein molybdopterin-binding subunit [Stellaceae bacterium]